MKSKNIQSLLFDLGNVIIDIDEDGAMERLRNLLRPETNPGDIKKTIIAYETGNISTDIFINSLISQSRKNVQALDIIEAWNSMLVDLPAYRLEMLDMLRLKYNVYLLSNTNELHLEWVHRHLLQVHEVDDFEKRYFDSAYYSHLVKDRKPNASIFQHIIEDSFLVPGHTLYMDDVKANIDIASSLGFITHHVQPGEEIAEFLKINGLY